MYDNDKERSLDLWALIGPFGHPFFRISLGT